MILEKYFFSKQDFLIFLHISFNTYALYQCPKKHALVNLKSQNKNGLEKENKKIKTFCRRSPKIL